MSCKLTLLLTKNVQSALDEVLSRHLLTCENVSFTTDKWQSKGKHPYISLTLHYVNKKFVLRKFLIGCKSTEGLTTPAKLALIKNMIRRIQGLRQKEKCARTMVHDIGMNKKVKKSKLADQQMNCIDHVINNALKAALNHKEVAPLVATATDLVDGFHRSLKRTSLLRSTCNKLDINYKKIPKPVPTRWNSVCKTIKAIMEMAPVFSKLLGSGKIEGDFQAKLPSDQIVTSLIHLLEPLEQIKNWSELL